MPRRRKEWLTTIFLVLCFRVAWGSSFRGTTPRIETWTGRWLPERPRLEKTTEMPDIADNLHGIKMGVASSSCDDAKTNLTLDWDYAPINYTCFSTFRISPDTNMMPILEKEHIPLFYVAQHKCMDKPIHYNVLLPTFGPHRPLWPRYGEYEFVPRQRWLHNLEHGGIVALYHPCANPLEINRLREEVKRCLWRHIISPSNLVDPKRPFVLISWGWRLSMPTAQPNLIRQFIQEHALKGPEAIYRDGQYDVGLLTPAQLISTVDDNVLCP